MNNSNPKTYRRFGFHFGILAAICFLFSQPAEARTYDTMVTIYDYYGLQGVDSRGNKIYGAKIMQGGNYYHVEMLTPMPCLKDHRYEKARVTVTENNTSCMDVVFDGHRARVSRVTRIDTRKPSYSDFYHDTAASDREHDHGSHTQRKRWTPFKFWD